MDSADEETDFSDEEMYCRKEEMDCKKKEMDNAKEIDCIKKETDYQEGNNYLNEEIECRKKEIDPKENDTDSSVMIISSTDEELDSACEDMDSADEEIDITAINEELMKDEIDNIETDIFQDENDLESNLMKHYPHDLQFYKNSLIGQISLDELENFTNERYEVLSIMSNLSKESSIKSYEYKECLLGLLRNKGFEDTYVKLITSPGCDSNTLADLELRRRDHISHFILKVALCKKIKIFRWLIEVENKLFELRFRSLNQNGIEKFLFFNNFNFPQLSEEEKNENRENLLMIHKFLDFDNTVFYKIPYLKVRNLVSHRKIFLKGGIVFLPSTEIIHVILQSFKDSYTKEMKYLRNVAKEDHRLIPILKKFSRRSEKSIFLEPNSLSLDSIDEFAETSFPLCMRTMHEALRRENHLKNDARFQYGMFLKLIGLSYDSAVEFWQREFLQFMDLDTFNKQYVYNIKYIYGKVGQKANYQSYSCASIINSTVRYGTYHGCPYKNMSQDTLRSKLEKIGVTDQGILEIEDLVKSERYQEACSTCFLQTHKVYLPKMVNSPSSYFNSSQNEILRRKHIQIRMNETLNETNLNKSAIEMEAKKENLL